MNAGFDLIGDIHGFADELHELLERLGYSRQAGIWQHPLRRAIFVGDFIDRGPQIEEVLSTVRTMVESDAALAVMGNHEFNALAFHTLDPQRPGEFLRPHHSRNVQQHSATLHQLDSSKLRDALDWFRTLPMWLEMPELRVVHACWHAPSIRIAEAARRRHGGVNDTFLEEALDQNTDLFRATETVLKGQEARLPDGVVHVDKDGHERRRTRLRWFSDPTGATWRSHSFPAAEAFPEIALDPRAASLCSGWPADERPVFFGHYWLRADQPAVLTPNVACLDFSVAKGGRLAAYRWSGERKLDNAHWVSVPANASASADR